MNRSEQSYFHKLKKDVAIPQAMDDRLEDIYTQIRNGQIRMKAPDPDMQRRPASRREDTREGTSESCFSVNRGVSKNAVWKWTAAAALCMIFLLSGLCFANPAFAKDLPILGDVFERLLENRANSLIGHKDQTALESIAEHSAPVDEAPAAPENEASVTNRAEDAGIVMTVSDAYCDGYDLYYTFSVQTEDSEMNQADYLLMLRYEEGDPFPYGSIHGSVNGYETEVTLQGSEKSGDGAFVSLARINFAELTREMLAEEMTVELEIDGVGAHQTDLVSDTMAGYKTVRGNWKLRFQVRMDTSNNRTALIDSEQNGFRVQKAVQTPSNTHVECTVPEEWAEKGLVFILTDDGGNRTHVEFTRYSRQDDGSSLYDISFYRSEADHLTLQVYDKNGTAQGQGDIPLPLLAEIPLDMTAGAVSD